MIPRPLLASLIVMSLIALGGAAQAPAPGAEAMIPFTAPADEAGLETVAPELARRVIAALPPSDRDKDPNTAYQLAMAAKDYPAADGALDALRRRYRTIHAPLDMLIHREVLTAAGKMQAQTGGSFEAAVAAAFQRIFVPLDDKTAASAARWTLGSASAAKQLLDADLAATRGKTAIPLQQATDLILHYWQYRVYYVEQPHFQQLIEQDDARRFVVTDDVLIKTPQGVTLSAYIARPRHGPARQPTALNFTIYADPIANRTYAKYAAACGYVGVVADARGKRLSPDEIRPFETEGEDADAIIDWIARQPWSDGRVGMFGGSYSGFAQWAAVKHRPAALKTIVPYVANLPGDGLPMEHNVFLNANYAWNFYVADNRYLDEALYGDPRWGQLPFKWFASGRPYREIDAVDGMPNPWRQRQLQHPSYDAYWQAMAPYGREFAKIDIPILEISGYSGADSVSNYFVPEHEHYAPQAPHYLVIGPSNHVGSQSAFKAPVLDGYPIDPVAQFDTPALTFEWFDYILKGGPKPTLLKDRINFQVMGANTWGHAPSIARMSDKVLKLYLAAAPAADGRYRLSLTPPGKSGYVPQTVDFADRISNSIYPAALLSDRIETRGVLTFVSDPIDRPLSVNGQIAGALRAVINKRDMDFNIAVYEVMPDGRYFNLAYYQGRASYAWDMSRRRLLTPGKIETIPFSRTGIISRQMSRGSRLLVLLGASRSPFAQVNYGTGKDVSDESIADAKEPLQVRWYSDSVIRVPVSEGTPRSAAAGSPGTKGRWPRPR